MIFRKYNEEKDKKALHRIIAEIDWHKEGIELAVKEGRNIVAEIDGEIEAFASSSLGKINYLESKIDISEIGTVATSLSMRKQGIAGKLTALKIAEDALAGAALSILGMFDQGYYDKLGFGTGNYTHWITFPIKALKIEGKPRVPKRLKESDWKAINESMHERMNSHGSFSASPDLLKAVMKMGGMGFGYFNINRVKLICCDIHKNSIITFASDKSCSPSSSYLLKSDFFI